MLSFQGGVRVRFYKASKSGRTGLTKALASEWAARGINVKAIAPGCFTTNNTEALLRRDPQPPDPAVDPGRRLGPPEDLAGVAVFLASRASDYTHGTIEPETAAGWRAEASGLCPAAPCGRLPAGRGNRDMLKRTRMVARTLAAIMAVVSVGLAAEARAQDDTWQRDSSTGKTRPNAAVSGNFAVLQIATTDPGKLMADWLQPTPGVSVTTSTSTPRNKPIVTFIVFKGCSGDASGNCNVTVDYETLEPSGKSYNQTKAAEVWVGHPPAPGLALQLSVSGYGIVFEDKDPLGPYIVRAAITDHVAGVTLHTEQQLTASEQ
jgi:hypothetical protein